MNIFQKMALTKSLKRDIVGALNRYVDEKQQNDERLLALAYLVSEREQEIVNTIDGVRILEKGKAELANLGAKLEEQKKFLEMYGNNPDYIRFQEITRKIESLEQEKKSATKMVNETEHYTHYENRTTFMPTGKTVVPFISRVPVDRTRTVSKQVQDTAMQAKLQKQIDALTAQLSLVPQKKEFEKIGDIPENLHKLRKEYKEIWKSVHDKDFYTTILEDAKKFLENLSKTDGEIKSQLQSYQFNLKTYERARDAYVSLEKQLRDFKQYKFISNFNLNHYEKFEIIHRNIRRNCGYVKAEIIEKIIDQTFTLTPVREDYLRKGIEIFTKHCNELIQETTKPHAPSTAPKLATNREKE